MPVRVVFFRRLHRPVPPSSVGPATPTALLLPPTLVGRRSVQAYRRCELEEVRIGSRRDGGRLCRPDGSSPLSAVFLLPSRRACFCHARHRPLLQGYILEQRTACGAGGIPPSGFISTASCSLNIWQDGDYQCARPLLTVRRRHVLPAYKYPVALSPSRCLRNSTRACRVLCVLHTAFTARRTPVKPLKRGSQVAARPGHKTRDILAPPLLLSAAALPV